VKVSLYWPVQTFRVPEVEFSRISRQPSHEGGKVISPTHRSPLPLYRIHNNPPPVPILSQISPVHVPSHLLKIYFNIIVPSMFRSSKWCTFLRFSPRKRCMQLSYPSFRLIFIIPRYILNASKSVVMNTSKFSLRKKRPKNKRFCCCYV
jgi:hypothetical protein